MQYILEFSFSSTESVKNKNKTKRLSNKNQLGRGHRVDIELEEPIRTEERGTEITILRSDKVACQLAKITAAFNVA